MKKYDIVGMLQKNGVQPSYHRIKIFEYLVTKKTHPTVDEIYLNLVKEIPTLSKTTVYNTLKLLSDKRVASTITVEDNEMRYDYIEDPHLHFKCLKCGKIYDIFTDCDVLNKKSLDGHTVYEHHLNLKGLCRACKLS